MNCILGRVHGAEPLKAARVLTIRELFFWHDRISSEAHLNDPAKNLKKNLKKIMGYRFRYRTYTKVVVSVAHYFYDLMFLVSLPVNC